jgi:antitoxin Phd
MSNITVTQARRRFGEMLSDAQNDAVFVSKRGEPAAVVVSAEEFERLLKRGSSDADDAIHSFTPRTP